MDALIIEWLNLAMRWFHVVAGIAWIGASFYFIWLDLSLRTPPQWKLDQGVKGDLWAIHGGGIYEVAKYQLRPTTMPGTLHWFKWEAYSTWLSGTGLMILLYYVQAQSYLVGPDRWLADPVVAVVASIGFITVGQLLYEGLLRTALVKRGLLFAAALIVLLTLASWLAHQLFAARAAYLHVGALMATWMAGNVFWGIIPAQKKFIAAVEAEQQPDASIAAFAKLRSTHNNYLTLPVIFCMISNHYPFLYGHPLGWLALIAVAGCLAWGRHFFNLKHQGIKRPAILFSAAAGVIVVAVAMQLSTAARSSSQANVAAIDDSQVAHIVTQHCANCHAATPTQPGFTAAPGGILLTSPTELALTAVRATPALQSGYMPLGNFSGMTTDERDVLIAWLQQQGR
ncbi:urate hydroxylase PuuD [Neiella marina]|uniref:Urate hydroxylase PuuD n=1 Tax=Neiella holothuriorum TaxID=2870530 RepID=A0ABS7EBU0_9GAMM|nr:urate hydroxylase PuuD [Neiella holothuriorum]MBW8189793.1 urate hydroxylase PuuD [Neiella holothuriorum]